MEKIDFKTGTFYLGDCFDVMATLPAGSVDMILNDPPYGTTACAWDSVLPLDKMWAEYWRLLKAIGAVAMTASQPFTTTLISSQIKYFRYAWVWDKINKFTGSLNANKRPLKAHEDVCVFSKNQTVYNKQHIFEPRIAGGHRSGHGEYVGDVASKNRKTVKSSSNGELVPHNPISILSIKADVRDEGFLHPTQKPVALFEYLIRTYTNPGELVLDNTAGSGTTAIVAIQSGRRWICIERDPGYFEKAIARVWEAEAKLDY